MILWVDDDNVNSLRAYIDELEEAGYEITIAKDPDEMWLKLSESVGNVNCIIMDILMPTGESVNSSEAEMGISTGLVLLKKIRDNEKYNSIPLIILTILSDSKYIEWARQNNVPFLNKQEALSIDLLKAVTDLNIKKVKS